MKFLRPLLLTLLALPLCAYRSAGQTLSSSTQTSTTLGLPTWTPSPRYEVRAVWLTTLSGLDWPSRPARNEAEAARQKLELCQILDALQADGINTVLFQTRIRSTVAYPSSIEPWDGAFSGRIGVAPPYDPLAFVIEEAHRRGMELHAWVVSFPILSTAQAKQLGRRALSKQRPELCRLCGDKWMMDPGVPATADYIASICREIVERYDVDGIHLDYIRYPEAGIPWNDAATYRRYGNGKRLADWRRDNVTRVVQTVHDAVKSVRPWVKLSCSPVGKRADLPRQSSYGWNARDAVCQDAATWLRTGLMDMLFPMMYFDGKHFYPFACDWKEQCGGRPVVPGLGIYFLSEREKNWPLSVVTRQLEFLRQIGLGGAAYYRSRFLTDDTKGLQSFLRSTYNREPALTPPMTWIDSIAPSVPCLSIERCGFKLRLSWTASVDNATSTAAATPVHYNLYRLPADSANTQRPQLIAHRLTMTNYELTPATPAALHARYAVTAVDAYGNESEAAVAKAE